MPNGLDAKVNGSGASRKSGEAPANVPSSGDSAAHASGADADAALSDLAVANLGFAEDLYFQFLNDPASVEPAWRRIFEKLNGSNGNGMGASALVPPTAFTRSIFSGGTLAGSHTPGAGVAGSRISVRLLSERVQRLVEGYRELGHLTADLDPLGLVRRKLPPIALQDFGLDDADLDLVFSSENVAGPDRTTLRDLVGLLRETYSRTIGVELAHLHDVELRSWVQNRMEATRNRLVMTRADRLRILDQVIGAEVLEQFLQNKFLGYKRFSLEGAESLIPLLERLIERAARSNVVEIVIGMAHRGRLNVLANVLQKPASEIFAEFQDKVDPNDPGSGGDVKYHLGFSIDRTFGPTGADSAAHKVHVSLAFNPSHLEWVNTVVQGRVRAKQDRVADSARTRCLPLLIHGDAAFSGQGIVAESLNMSDLDGYRVGGTVHIIVNNQVGFTTSPRDAKSTTYATDVARMLQIPIFHVNGEDPEAVSQVVDLAIDFRQRFHRDAIIELWCYRKLGHNEGDEPSYTQPVMYRTIASKPSIRMAYLAYDGANPSPDGPRITVEETDAIAAAKRHALEAQLEIATKAQTPPRPSTFAGAWARIRGGADSLVPEVPTAASPSEIQEATRAITTTPPDFTVHPKLKAVVIDGRAAMGAGDKPIDWGMGEALAFGTLLAQGVRVRLSGQDARRGTFSHRHSVLIDYNDGHEYTPLAHVRDKQGTFEPRDSPLSEGGVLGFDYGYSLDMPEGLTIWEAQFGDFVNAAQVIIDQFLCSSEAKWHRVSGLVMLLPHGMEGQGPEHSNARLDRFLNLCVNDNMQVCNLTTPAQYFHVLRRQVLRPYRKPLIIMSPKSLLRSPAATSALAEFTGGSFRHIIPDVELRAKGQAAETVRDPKRIKRVLLCTGKIYYDLVATREERGYDDVAIVRVEQLYPLRKDDLLEVLSVYTDGTPVVWVQEEPKNMGAWAYMNREMQGLLAGSFHWSCVSRPLSASPATGSTKRHAYEQARIMTDAFGRGV